MKSNHQDEILREIDSLDRSLVQALEKRLKLAAQLPNRNASAHSSVEDYVAQSKYSKALASIMQAVVERSEDCLDEAYCENKRLLKIACFGVPGSFTHQALDEYFEGKTYERCHFNLFEEVVSSVCEEEVDYGVLPIENSSTGGITEVYDLLRKHDCSIVGERRIKIEQCLLGLPEANLDGIRNVFSHPQGLLQSKAFFKNYPLMQQTPYYSTSKSAEMVAEKGDVSLAAVAGKKAAELYGLKVLAANINSNANNYTRFVVISKETTRVVDANKITVVLTVNHEPGSLYKTLGHFYHGGLNLMNLESRPLEGKSWEYFFHIDLQGNLADPCVNDALIDVRNNCTFFKILGNYRADERF